MDSFRGQVRDYDWGKWTFGPQAVERTVEDAKHREAAKKEQRRAKWKLSCGTR